MDNNENNNEVVNNETNVAADNVAVEAVNNEANAVTNEVAVEAVNNEVNAVANNETNEVTNDVNNEGAKKEKNNKPIMIGAIVAAVVVIAVVLCFVLGVFGGKKEDSKGNNDKKDEPIETDTTKRTDVTYSDFNGVYKNGDDTIKIYAIDRDTIIVIKGEDNYYYFEFAGDHLYEESFRNMQVIVLYKNAIGIAEGEMEFDEEGYSLDFDFDKHPATTYKKEKDYTKEDAYKDLYGDPDLVESKYSGYYELESGEYLTTYPEGKVSLYTIEQEDKTVEIIYQGYDSYISENNFTTSVIGNDYGEIQEDGTVKTENVTLTFNGDSIVISVHGEKDQYLGALAGTYKKVRNITIDDVFENA